MARCRRWPPSRLLLQPHLPSSWKGTAAHAVVSPLPRWICVFDATQADGKGATDASGNPILSDIGVLLRSEFKKYFKVSLNFTVLYFNSYEFWVHVAWPGTPTTASRSLSKVPP